jgi:hypothetical protein
MNCYSTHLMQYLLAKMLLAAERLVADSGGDVREVITERWLWLLHAFGMAGDVDCGDDNEEQRRLAHAACVDMLATAFKQRGPMTGEQGDALRTFFRDKGRCINEFDRPCTD